MSDRYGIDPGRQHGFEAAVAEYDRLVVSYSEAGYEVVVLPKTTVGERADFVVGHLSRSNF